ncbi:MAG: phosphoenolpyruvate hydrolase family protein [Rhodobacteraceae bacterium]|nr:phosphoenolpyruvate hydrolase family protein [Paracoccaceae bacterium]
MSNPPVPDQHARQTELLIAAQPRAQAGTAESPERQILAPWMDLLPANQRDLLSLLPVADVNGALFAALGGLEQDVTAPALPDAARPGTIAGLLCVDPFLRVHDVLRLLGAAGISAIANFPTIQVVDGATARVFDSADLGVKREFRILAQFARAGVAITGFATTDDAAERLLEIGVSDLVFHPGLASSDWRARAVAARQAKDCLRTLRPRCQIPLRLFCPDAFGTELDAARALADGLVRYA